MRRRALSKAAALNRINQSALVNPTPLLNSQHPDYPAQQQQSQSIPHVFYSVNSAPANQHAEPLLSHPAAVISPSVVPLTSAYPLAYPILQAAPVPSAPPAYAYQRMY